MSTVDRLALLLLVVLIGGCTQESSQPSASDSPVTVTIGGPIRDVTGVYWPAGDAVETLAIEKPRTLTLRLPSGRSWTCRSKITFLSQAEETVSRVEVAPLQEMSDFASAAAALTRILEELGVAADSTARERLTNWQSEAPAWGPSATQTLQLEVEQGIEMVVEIKPAGAENKWFLLCSFDTRRAAQPNASPTR